jgi:hypothetical protein
MTEGALESKQMSFKGMDDSIAFSIWQQLDKFGSEMKKLFEEQFYPMNCIPIGLNCIPIGLNCIPIGLDEYTTQVHQMQKIHISSLTMMYLI